MMIMPTRPRLIFAIFFITSVLVLTIHLRTTSSRVFNRYRSAVVIQEQLKNQLRQEQLRIESLMSPQNLMEHLKQQQPVKDKPDKAN